MKQSLKLIALSSIFIAVPLTSKTVEKEISESIKKGKDYKKEVAKKTKITSSAQEKTSHKPTSKKTITRKTPTENKVIKAKKEAVTATPKKTTLTEAARGKTQAKPRTSPARKRKIARDAKVTPKAEDKALSERASDFLDSIGLGTTNNMLSTTGSPYKATRNQEHNSVLAALENDTELSTFTQALKRNGLADQFKRLDDPSKFTVFAPTNNAFLHIQEKNISRELLESHILDGKKSLDYPTLKGRKILNTTAHTQRHIEHKGNRTEVDGVPLSGERIIDASNGIIYVIEHVLPVK